MGSLFGVPAMLWWGLAAAIPILIHLFARQRFRRVSWAAMDLLQRAFKKTRKRIRLEHLLLLLLRILAILAFVLALAAPLVDAESLLGGDGRRREVVIVLDDSFSMGLKEADGTTPFLRAKDHALRLVRSLRQDRGDSVTVVTAGKPARLVLKGSEDLEKAFAEIEHVELGDAATDMVGAFQTVVAALEDLDEGPQVYLLSDLQRVAFSPPSEAAAAAGSGEDVSQKPQQILASLVQQMRARKATINIVAPRETSTDNLAVTSLTRQDKTTVAGIPARIEAVVHNFGVRPQRGVLHLYVDGGADPVDFRDLELIAPGASQAVDFRYTFQAPGSHNLEVRLVSDNLAVDNRRALAIEVRDRIRTVVVDGDPRKEPGEQESYFLVAALDPGVEGERPPFAIEVMEETRFDSIDLKDVDLLVLMNVALISPRRAEDIQRMVEEGGGLLVFLGDRVKASTFNSLLWKGGSGVLPAEILDRAGEGRESEVSYEITNPDLDHPIFEHFRGATVLPWLSYPAVYEFFRTQAPGEEDPARTLAWLDRRTASLPRQEPAILEKTLGRGRTLLVTTTGDADWTDLPALPTYVLLVREMAWHLTRREARFENLIVGQAYLRLLHGFASEVMLGRDGEQVQVLKPMLVEGTQTYEVTTPALMRSGVWRLDLVRQQQENRTDPSPIYVAVNVDPTESDLARIGQDYVAANFPGDDVNFIEDATAAQETRSRGRDGRGWWWALLAAAALLAMDTLLSQVFGLRTKGAAA